MIQTTIWQFLGEAEYLLTPQTPADESVLRRLLAGGRAVNNGDGQSVYVVCRDSEGDTPLRIEFEPKQR